MVNQIMAFERRKVRPMAEQVPLSQTDHLMVQVVSSWLSNRTCWVARALLARQTDRHLSAEWLAERQRLLLPAWLKLLRVFAQINSTVRSGHRLQISRLLMARLVLLHQRAMAKLSAMHLPNQKLRPLARLWRVAGLRIGKLVALRAMRQAPKLMQFTLLALPSKLQKGQFL